MWIITWASLINVSISVSLATYAIIGRPMILANPLPESFAAELTEAQPF